MHENIETVLFRNKFNNTSIWKNEFIDTPIEFENRKSKMFLFKGRYIGYRQIRSYRKLLFVVDVVLDINSVIIT